MARPILVDSMAELLLVDQAEENNPTIFVAFFLEGPFDPEIFRASLRRAVVARPFWRARLGTRRWGLWRRPAWLPEGGTIPLEIRDLRRMERRPVDLAAWFHAHAADRCSSIRLSRGDLSAKSILIMLPEDTVAAVFVFHHAITDGVSFFDVARDVFGHYHQTVTGIRPPWSRVPSMHSMIRTVRPVTPVSWSTAARAFAQEARRLAALGVETITSRQSGRVRRLAVRRSLPGEVLVELRRRARRAGGSVTDLVITASKLALHAWNEARGVSPAVQVHNLVVNARARTHPREMRGFTLATSAVSIPSLPGERTDPDALLRRVATLRRSRLADGLDVLGRRAVLRFMQLAHLLPLEARYALFRRQSPVGTTCWHSNVGLVWPEIRDGRPTGRTAIRDVGQARLFDFTTMSQTTTYAKLSVTCWSAFDRLFVNLCTNERYVSPADAEGFSALLNEKLLGFL